MSIIIGWLLAALGSGGGIFFVLRVVWPIVRDLLWNTQKYLPLRDTHVLQDAQRRSIRPEEQGLRLRYADGIKSNLKNFGLICLACLSGVFGWQWHTNDKAKDEFKQEATNERLNKEAAIRQRDEFVKANRDFAQANGQLRIALDTNNANCRQAITNANVRANLEIDKTTAKKKELIKHALKPKADGAGEPSVPDPDDLLRAFAQSAPGTDASLPAATGGTGEDPS